MPKYTDNMVPYPQPGAKPPKRSFVAAAALYFGDEGKSFVYRLLLRFFPTFMVGLGIADDATIVGIADDVITLPVLIMFLVKIWHRRDRVKYPDHFPQR